MSKNDEQKQETLRIVKEALSNTESLEPIFLDTGRCILSQDDIDARVSELQRLVVAILRKGD